MNFNFDENEAVDQICSKVVETFEIDLKNDNISNILGRMGFELRSNYLSEETSSIIYYNPTGKVPEFNTGLGMVINKRFFDLTDNDLDNVIILRDAVRFILRSQLTQSRTSVSTRTIYEEEPSYKVAQSLLNQMLEPKKTNKKIIKMFVK